MPKSCLLGTIWRFRAAAQSQSSRTIRKRPKCMRKCFLLSPTDRNGFGGTNRKLSRWKRRKQKMECGRGKASRDDRQTHHYEYPRLFWPQAFAKQENEDLNGEEYQSVVRKGS